MNEDKTPLVMMPIESYQGFWTHMLGELSNQGFRKYILRLNDKEFVSQLTHLLSIGHKNLRVRDLPKTAETSPVFSHSCIEFIKIHSLRPEADKEHYVSMQVLIISLLNFVNFPDDMNDEVTDIAIGIAAELLKRFDELTQLD